MTAQHRRSGVRTGGPELSGPEVRTGGPESPAAMCVGSSVYGKRTALQHLPIMIRIGLRAGMARGTNPIAAVSSSSSGIFMGIFSSEGVADLGTYVQSKKGCNEDDDEAEDYCPIGQPDLSEEAVLQRFLWHRESHTAPLSDQGAVDLEASMWA